MTRALLELQLRLLRGRLHRWLRLLRQPRYLLGLLGVALWLGLFLGPALLRAVGGTLRVGGGGLDELLARLPPGTVDGPLTVAAFAAAAVVASGWIIPWRRAALHLNEAEIALLLPAPLRRSQVIAYALLRSQAGVLFGALILVVFASRGSPGQRLALLLVVWLLLTLWDLHAKARDLWHARLREMPRAAALRRRLAVGAGWVLYLGAAGTTLMLAELQARTAAAGVRGRDSLIRYLEALGTQAWETGASTLLAPLRWILAPLLAQGAAERATALLVPAVLLTLHAVWVVRSQARFEDASLERARRLADAAEPAAKLRRTSDRARRRIPFPLPPAGHPAVAIVWKNLLQRGRRRLSATLLLGAAALAAATLAVAFLPALPALRLAEILLVLMGAGGAVLLLLFPLLSGLHLRTDLRTDLLHAEVIRPWPLPGTTLVAAEVAAPVVQAMLRALLGGGLLLGAHTGGWLRGRWSGDALGVKGLPDGWLASLGASDGVALLALVAGCLPLALGVSAVSTAVQNLAALLFPGWVRLGAVRQKGAARFGQNLLVTWVLFLAVVIGVLPGLALAGAVVAVQWLAGLRLTAWELPILGVVAALPLLVEAAGLIWAAGRAWERLDPGQELLGEA